MLPPMEIKNKHLLAEALIEADLLSWDASESDEAVRAALIRAIDIFASENT
jgi:hypothetical protein